MMMVAAAIRLAIRISSSRSSARNNKQAPILPIGCDQSGTDRPAQRERASIKAEWLCPAPQQIAAGLPTVRFIGLLPVSPVNGASLSGALHLFFELRERFLADASGHFGV